jgi:hypothetical protein
VIIYNRLLFLEEIDFLSWWIVHAEKVACPLFYYIAMLERAILDCLYFNLLPNVDNSDKVNPGFLKRISSFYPRTVQRKIKKYMGTS